MITLTPAERLIGAVVFLAIGTGAFTWILAESIGWLRGRYRARHAEIEDYTAELDAYQDDDYYDYYEPEPPPYRPDMELIGYAEARGGWRSPVIGDLPTMIAEWRASPAEDPELEWHYIAGRYYPPEHMVRALPAGDWLAELLTGATA